ncbi:hypothetical protein [Streptomyces sp. NRRL F-2580]|uniref:hypothetical protein n=1 Tax=Streptomyces sp. NRRL F-2580 TaxID=1463841 RepID=UPI00131D73C5|nr:hypothetical protein [Streptomyces sp. NRRL F-2580]
MEQIDRPHNGGGHPRAPCWQGPAGRCAEIVLSCREGSQGGLLLLLGSEGAGEAEMEEGAGGGVLGAFECVLEDSGGGGVVLAPCGLVGEVAEHGGTEVGVVGGVGTVEAGDPEFAGGGVVAVVEAVPGDGLGEGRGQSVEAQAGGAGPVGTRAFSGSGPGFVER